MANVEFYCPVETEGQPCEAELVAEIDADPAGASILSIVAPAGDCPHVTSYSKLLAPSDVEALETAAFSALEDQDEDARDRDINNRIDAARGK